MNNQTERRAWVECVGKEESTHIISNHNTALVGREIKIAAQGEQLYRRVIKVMGDGLVEEIFEQVEVPTTIASDERKEFEQAITLVKSCWRAAEADLKKAQTENEQLLSSLNEARAAEKHALNDIGVLNRALIDRVNEKCSLQNEIKTLKEQSHKIEWIPYVNGVTDVGSGQVVWLRVETKVISKRIGNSANALDAMYYLPIPPDPVATPVDEAGIALDQWLGGGIATASAMIAFKAGFKAAKEPKGEK